ncbi:hypothetical protein GUITHDRAFT_131773 [Guillardia theta CCMP2712]|uniref:peptidyl-tRNA hydrolase n=1 Tax=Guillardia theta (strain CCMP2712) TaxID=905079 RepID=L1K2R4_GUITC|nr:hypothetical protein GUITHDRAFT_131773 [Guillardia theta CCMP2712]EKX54745.1 hypothetical protein GUITHDRAFT_131773 [Guillardia theta CCMP2712]|eukprot:XP_005841725.1 hypothetical protein GUITHDRAFT_131773 [Guillardia theta CCMP2712]
MTTSKSFRTALRGGASDEVSPGEAPKQEANGDYLVQYVLIRKDLPWPAGSVVAQGCHAVTKALWEYKEHQNVIDYCGQINSMHKVVLGVKDRKQLEKFAGRLEEAGLLHCIWVEQPEDTPTALATLPYPKSTIGPLLKKLPLLQ